MAGSAASTAGSGTTNEAGLSRLRRTPSNLIDPDPAPVPADRTLPNNTSANSKDPQSLRETQGESVRLRHHGGLHAADW